MFEDLVAESGRHRRALALDWRGHGESAPFSDDFGEKELIEDGLAVIEASGVRRVVPVALAHAGWVAIELRRRLGAKVPKLVLMEWLIFEAPPPFQEALQGMRSAKRWREIVGQIFSLWLHGAPPNTRGSK